ncbi:unnamed protein product [Sphagnum balticum]
MRESTTIWQSASTGDNPEWVSNQDRTMVTKEDTTSSSDSDTGTDGNEHGDVVFSLVKQVDYEDEFEEGELEKLVRSEGPREILQLMLQEQLDDFMNEELTKADDYADWIRWVADAEQSGCAKRTPDAAVTLVLQQPSPCDVPSIPTLRQVAQIKDVDSDRRTTERLDPSSHEEMDTRWSEMCRRIRIDGNLDEGRQQQL